MKIFRKLTMFCFCFCVCSGMVALPAWASDECGDSDPNVSIRGCTAKIQAGGRALDIAVYYQNRAAAYSRLKQYDKAIADFTQALNLGNHHPLIYCNRANTYNQIHQYDAAIADANMAIKIVSEDSHPEYLADALAKGYAVRALAYLGKNDRPRAEADFRKALTVEGAPDWALDEVRRMMANNGITR